MTDRLAEVAWGLLAPLADPASRLFAPSLVVAGLLAVALSWRARGGLRLADVPRTLGLHLWSHRSARLDLELLVVRKLLELAGLVPVLASAWAIAAGVLATLDRTVGTPSVSVDPALATVVYTAVLFVAWDASRYLLHRLMHEVPALWELHQVHHSAEVLTPLTFFRLHPLEAVLYGLRGAVVTGVVAGAATWVTRDPVVQATLFGVHAGGFALNAVFGNLRHSHVWLGFGDRIERWLVSPAQHQLHHSADEAHIACNYGTWLAVWDRAGGTLVPSSSGRPSAFGLATPGNHAPDDLIGALTAPVLGITRHLTARPARVAVPLLALLLAGVARGQEDDEAVDEDEDLVLVVESRGGVPRVAGSAHLITEEELERHEYDDIHRILAEVPGVYVRGEDGFGLRPNIGLRGANSDRSAKVTLMEDGVLLGPAPYAAPAAYYFPMSTRLTGVEVFKGPAATRFGPSTIGGAINLITRAVPRGPLGMLDLGAGPRSTLKVHAVGGTGDERWGVLVEATSLSTGGFKVLDTGGPTGFVRQEAMAKARLASADDARVHHTLLVKGGFSHERSDETYLGLTRDDFAATPYRRYAASALDQMRWRRSQAELDWRVKVGRTFDIRTVAYHHWVSRQWFKLNRFADGPPLEAILSNPDAGQAAIYAGILRGETDTTTDQQVLRVGTNDRRFQSFGLQSVAHLRHDFGVVRSQTEVGLRLHGDVVKRVHTEDPFAMTSGVLVPTGVPRVTNLDRDTTALAFAGHIQEDLAIGPVRLLPGARVEVIRTTLVDQGVPTDPITRVIGLPGFGALVSARSWLDVFAGVHRGFTPVAPESAAASVPETSLNVEAGLRATPGGSHLEVVGFFNDYANLAGQCTFAAGCTDDQVGEQFSAGKAIVYGAEVLVGHGVPLPAMLRLDARLAYTFTGSRFQTSFLSGFPQFGAVQAGDRLPYVPEHQGALRVSLQHPRFDFGVAANLRGAMRDQAGQGAIADDRLIPTAFTLDVASTVVLTRHVSTYLTLTNVTNQVNLSSARPFGARPDAPFQAMAGVKVRLGRAAGPTDAPLRPSPR